MTAATRRVLAELFAVTLSETPYGGQARSYEALGTVWLAPGPMRARQRSGPNGQRRIEGRRAISAPDPRLTAGRVLAFEGANWRIVAVATVRTDIELDLERLS